MKDRKNKMLAYHFDLKRGLWSREYMERMVHLVNGWGYDTIVLEIEDKLRFKGHPDISAPDALTPEAMGSFAEWCRERDVQVIPMMQSLGHAECVVGKPAYAHLRETPDVTDQYDPTSDEAKSLVMDLFDQIIDAVKPKEFFHMGGDETWSLGKSERLKPLVDQIGVGGLYMQHMLPLFEHIHKRGLRPMIWADICLSHPEVIADVPDYVVMVDWDYWTTAERPDRIMIWGGGENGRNTTVDRKKYKELDPEGTFKKHLAGYAVDERTEQDGAFRAFYCTDALKGMGLRDVVVAPANSCCGDTAGIPRNGLHVANCFHAAKKGMNEGAGCFVTSWVVRHCHSEVKQLSTFAAARALESAEFDFKLICREYASDVYGVEADGFSEAAELAGAVLPTMQAQILEQMRDAKDGDEAGFSTQLEYLVNKHGGKDAAIQAARDVKSGYSESRRFFEDLQGRAKRNSDNLDFWLEGIDLNAFGADVVIHALSDTLKDNASELLARMRKLRDRTSKLFAPTLTPEGLDLELNLRYGFYEKLLISSCGS